MTYVFMLKATGELSTGKKLWVAGAEDPLGKHGWFITMVEDSAHVGWAMDFGVDAWLLNRAIVEDRFINLGEL